MLESVTASWYSDLEIAANIKKRYPHVSICMVGTHVTAMWQETLEHQTAVDFVAIGEYDYTVAELAAALERDENNYSDIAGLAYRYEWEIVTNDRPAAH